MVSQVEHGDDVGVGAEAAHGLGFASDPCARDFVQPLSLDKSEGYLSVKKGVLGQVDFFPAALAQEALDLVAAIGEGGGLSSDMSRRAGRT